MEVKPDGTPLRVQTTTHSSPPTAPQNSAGSKGQKSSPWDPRSVARPFLALPPEDQCGKPLFWTVWRTGRMLHCTSQTCEFSSSLLLPKWMCIGSSTGPFPLKKANLRGLTLWISVIYGTFALLFGDGTADPFAMLDRSHSNDTYIRCLTSQRSHHPTSGSTRQLLGYVHVLFNGSFDRSPSSPWIGSLSASFDRRHSDPSRGSHVASLSSEAKRSFMMSRFPKMKKTCSSQTNCRW